MEQKGPDSLMKGMHIDVSSLELASNISLGLVLEGSVFCSAYV